jgi:hypothetical protein
MPDAPPVHVVIPDTQAKPGVPTDHLAWIGHYIVDQFAGRPNVSVVHLGDHWDMPSLSSYDKGKKKMEGRRYVEDVAAGNEAFAVLNAPLAGYNAVRRQYKEAQWWPERYLLRGNHEDRITRATENDAQLEGLLSLDQLESPGWTVVPFLEPLWLDGIGYCHYWANPMTGYPIGGMAATRLKTVGHSFTMGHQQVLDYALRFVHGQSQHALIAGACYLHDEEYKGPQGNAHWRGIIVCHQVEDGSYDPMFLSLDYLCRRYEGVRLSEFMADSATAAA